MTPALLVIAKAPAPGRSKTRLVPPCTLEEAAALAEAALADTLEAVARTGADRRVLALDGEPGSWLPAGFEVIPQRGRGLDERVAGAFEDVGGPALLIGMDTPQVTPDLLDSALGSLLGDGVDAVLGAAEDGGWWAAGLRQPDRRAFVGVPMSTASTGRLQREAFARRGLRVVALPVLRDVDLPEDARAVARLAPDSRFAARVAEVLGAAAGVEGRS